MPNIVTVKEIENLLKLSTATIYNLAAKQKIPGFKIGDSWRFDLEEVEKFIAAQKELSQRKA